MLNLVLALGWIWLAVAIGLEFARKGKGERNQRRARAAKPHSDLVTSPGSRSGTRSLPIHSATRIRATFCT
jgi:hypothetical protein